MVNALVRRSIPTLSTKRHTDLESERKSFDALLPGWSDEPGLRHDAVDMGFVLILLFVATVLGLVLESIEMHTCIVMVYVLVVQIIALTTIRRFHCLFASLVSVALYNYFFAPPQFSFVVLGKSTPATLAVMLIVAVVSSWAAMALRREVRASHQARRRDQIMLGTDRRLQACNTPGEVIRTGCAQLAKLLDSPVMWYRQEGDYLVADRAFDVDGVSYAPQDLTPEMPPVLAGAAHGDAAIDDEGPLSTHGLYLPVSCMQAHTAADGEPSSADDGTEPETVPGAKADRGAVRDIIDPAPPATDSALDAVLFPSGMMAVATNAAALSESERNIASAVAGETALALSRVVALAERERAMILARNEQMRANLLRSISHDLRTPLTAISGNADVLLTSDRDALSAEQRQQLVSDIRSDATWLTATVENLLAITKLEGGNVNLSRTMELMDDIIEEALRHVDPAISEHALSVTPSDNMALVNVDARLIVQVVVNLVNNAVAHTPAGSHVSITTRIDAGGKTVACTVADDGPGIAEADLPHIFDSFYTANHGLADGHRSVGLGLSLCRSIMSAHDGSIDVRPVQPHGCAFTLRLPACSLDESEMSYAD